MAVEERKLNHIDVCLKEDVESHKKAGFEDIHLIHSALPEIDRSEVDTYSELFGHRLPVPILIESMTGGTKEAAKINATLAEAAEKYGLAMGVGSQRAAIEDSSLVYTYRIAREKAPTAMLFANIGCAQLDSYGAGEIGRMLEMIDANALFIHLNPLQECVQPEGETKFRGVLSRISEVIKKTNVPVVVKETGAGISAEVARKLERVGVKGVDLSGVGGTSWAAVESFRAKAAKDRLHQKLGETFWDWGIPTAVSLVEVAKSTKLKVIASGGVRSGIDAAKAIALGASAVGLALPLLRFAVAGKEVLEENILTIIESLKTAMFLTGSKNLVELRKTPVVVTGETLDWLRQRGKFP